MRIELRNYPELAILFDDVTGGFDVLESLVDALGGSLHRYTNGALDQVDDRLDGASGTLLVTR